MPKIIAVLLLGMWLSACGSGSSSAGNEDSSSNSDSREENSTGADSGNETESNLYTFEQEINGHLDAPSVMHQDHYITLEQAALLTVELVHSSGIDFDFAIYDHEDNQLSYSYSPQLETSLKEYLVPSTYRVRVYTETENTGDYVLSILVNGLSYDGNNNWAQSHQLIDIKQDELTPYGSGTLDLMDFYTFTLEEDSSFNVLVDKANDSSRYQLRLYDANKNLLASNISSTYDLSVDGSLFAGQYYVVVDGVEARTFGSYNIELASFSAEVDEQSSVANPIELIIDEQLRGSLNVDHDPVDVYQLEVVTAGTHSIVLSINDTLTDGAYRIMIYDEEKVLVSEGDENSINFAELDIGTYFIKAEMLKGIGQYSIIASYW